MPLAIAHDPTQARFEVVVDGQHARLDYRPEADAVRLTHVIVPAAIEGRGIAGQLTKAALDWARTERLSVVPDCPYVKAWIERHPEYGALVVAG